MKNRFPLKSGDIILMALISALAVMLFLLPLLSEKSTTAEIVIAETGDKRTISLDKDASYDVSSRGIDLTVCVEKGEVFVSRSDCRDGICSATPPISHGGQTIVCAPAGIVIRVMGEEAIVDGIAG